MIKRGIKKILFTIRLSLLFIATIIKKERKNSAISANHAKPKGRLIKKLIMQNVKTASITINKGGRRLINPKNILLKFKVFNP